MKQCSKCNRKYEQKYLYCLEDGTTLNNEFDSEATIVKNSFSKNINLLHFGKWTRNEKLTFFGIIIALFAVVVSVMAWQMPPTKPPISCVLLNDKPDEKFVYARRNCDKKSCDDDPSLIIGSYPNNTNVMKRDNPVVRGDNFNWVQVELTGNGVTFWVAESKLKCN